MRLLCGENAQHRVVPGFPRGACDVGRGAIKNWISIALYAVSVPLAYVHPAIALVLAYIVAAIYFLPHAWLGEGARE